MIGTIDSHQSSRSSWQQGFLQLLPRILDQLRYAFSRLQRNERREAIQEAVANAFVAYVRLCERGQQSLAYATPLAHYAVRQVRQGRMVGNKLNVRDVMSKYCQRRKRITVEQLAEADQRTGQWRELLIEDRRSSPADIAATKLDFHAWLRSLSPKRRAITETLASGESTSRVAQMFGVTNARISQIRQELRAAWHLFQGELDQIAALTAA